MLFRSEEVLHIKEYVELEKIRFQDTLKVIFISSEIDDTTLIAPMLLIPFVENAFKHGNIINGFLSIEIHVKVEGTRLDFSVSNTMIKGSQQNNTNGIGLENIRKRLELNYNNNFKLVNENEKNRYVVKLSIFNLNEIQNA